MGHRSQMFVAGLAKKFSPLLGSLREHLEDNGNEILPHLLMSEYCRVALSSEGSEAWVLAFLEELERSFSLWEDDEISNVIAVSFIEHLPHPDEEHWIIERLGSKLRHQYNRFFSDNRGPR